MYVLCSNITIGGKRFAGVHEVKIKRSIHLIGATASVKVPVTAVLRQEERRLLMSKLLRLSRSAIRWIYG